MDEHRWGRQAGGNVRRPAYRDGSTEDTRLQGSGWTHGIAQPEIATAGTADSFLRASHVIRIRRAHQVTAAALYILQRRAYDKHSISAEYDQPPEDFKDWCHEKEKSSLQFL